VLCHDYVQFAVESIPASTDQTDRTCPILKPRPHLQHVEALATVALVFDFQSIRLYGVRHTGYIVARSFELSPKIELIEWTLTVAAVALCQILVGPMPCH